MKGELQNQDVQIGIIIEKLQRIEADITSINTKLEKHYVTSEEFKPIKAIVYGMVGLILSSVIIALITLVISK